MTYFKKISSVYIYCLTIISLVAFVNVLKALAQDNNKPIQFVGNKFSLKYHEINCPYALIMSKYKRVYFNSAQSAYQNGLRPCRYCLPYSGLYVDAVIVNK